MNLSHRMTRPARMLMLRKSSLSAMADPRCMGRGTHVHQILTRPHKFSRLQILATPANSAVLLIHSGQLILRKIVNLKPPDVRF